MILQSKKFDPAESEEIILQQFSAIWEIVIMEVLSQASTRSQNGFTVSENCSGVSKKGEGINL